MPVSFLPWLKHRLWAWGGAGGGALLSYLDSRWYDVQSMGMQAGTALLWCINLTWYGQGEGALLSYLNSRSYDAQRIGMQAGTVLSEKFWCINLTGYGQGEGRC